MCPLVCLGHWDQFVGIHLLLTAFIGLLLFVRFLPYSVHIPRLTFVQTLGVWSNMQKPSHFRWKLLSPEFLLLGVFLSFNSTLIFYRNGKYHELTQLLTWIIKVTWFNMKIRNFLQISDSNKSQYVMYIGVLHSNNLMWNKNILIPLQSKVFLKIIHDKASQVRMEPSVKH